MWMRKRSSRNSSLPSLVPLYLGPHCFMSNLVECPIRHPCLQLPALKSKMITARLILSVTLLSLRRFDQRIKSRLINIQGPPWSFTQPVMLPLSFWFRHSSLFFLFFNVLGTVLVAKDTIKSKIPLSSWNLQSDGKARHSNLLAPLIPTCQPAPFVLQFVHLYL